MESVLTSRTLWENFDPAAEQLDIDPIKQTERGGLVTKTLYFTGRTLPSGAKTRVFGTVCFKKTAENKPAVLVISNYSLPIEMSVLADIASRGFVAMSVDLAGRRPKGLHTIYPEELLYCNNEFARNMFEITETARETKLYEYTVSCRRAITYLLNEEHVSQVSVLTEGRGAYVGIIVLGVENRVKNGAILFGNLYRNFPVLSRDENVLDAGKDELERHIAYDTRRQQWTLGLAPQTYAQQIKVPVYVINSANSPFVDIVQTNKTMMRLNAGSRLLILPTSLDYLPKRYTDGVLTWLSGCKAKPRSEIKSFRNQTGDYCVSVNADRPLNKTSLWYCTDADSRAKHWTKATLTQGDNCYVAKLNLYEKECNVACFATFDDDVSTSTLLLTEKVAAVNVTKALNIIFSGTGKQTLVPLVTDGSWWNVGLEPQMDKGYLNILGAKGKALATFAINDKSIRINQSFTVVFDVCSNVRQRLELVAVTKFGNKNSRYSQYTQLVGNGKWEHVIFDKINFHRVDDGKQLPDAEKVEMLVILADEEILVNNIFLV